jgi:hypothetical protein
MVVASEEMGVLIRFARWGVRSAESSCVRRHGDHLFLARRPDPPTGGSDTAGSRRGAVTLPTTTVRDCPSRVERFPLAWVRYRAGCLTVPYLRGSR